MSSVWALQPANMPKDVEKRHGVFRRFCAAFASVRRRDFKPRDVPRTPTVVTVDEGTQTPIWLEEIRKPGTEGWRTSLGNMRPDRSSRRTSVRGPDGETEVDGCQISDRDSVLDQPRAQKAGTGLEMDDAQGNNQDQAGSQEPEYTGFRLLDLPLELRRSIYRHALPGEPDASEDGVPALLRSNLQICREAGQVCNRVLTIQLWNGYCGPFGDKRRMMKEAATRIKKLGERDQQVQIRIELMCRRSTCVLYWHLEPLLDVIRTTQLPRIEVHMAQSQICTNCIPPLVIDEKPWETVNNMVVRVERQRDDGFIRAGVYR